MSKILLFGDFKASDVSRFHPSDEIVEMIKKADVTVLNFEAPIESGGKGVSKSGPSICQDSQAPKVLMEMGVRVVLLANNHMMDFGEEGCRATMDAFKDVVTVGAGSSEEAYSVKVVEKDGKRIGFLALCQYEFGVLESKQEKGHGVAWALSLDVEDIIIKARQEVDYLIVCPHAGVEHTAAPLPEWRSLYKHFVEWGADAVIAGHPHCPQGWETYRGKPIYYSLGDFYFDELSYDDLWYKSLAIELTLGDTIEIKEHFLCFDDKTGLVSVDKSERMNSYIKHVNGLLQNDEEYKKYINAMCVGHWPGIKYGLLRGVCGVSLKMRLKYVLRLLGCMLLGNKDEMYLLNAFQNESHRWVIERYLRNNNIIQQ